MLIKLPSSHSIIRSIQTGTLLLAAVTGLSVAAQAGDETAVRSGKDTKDKNVIEQAPPAEPKFYLSLSGGAEFDEHATKFLSNGVAIFGPNPAVPAYGGNLYPAKIYSKDFSSTHDPVYDARAEVGYKVLPYLALFGGFTYSHGNGHERRVGYVTDTTGTTFGTPGAQRYDLYASFGDYQAYSGRGGFKLTLPRTILDFIHAPKAISPYFMGSIGGKYLESQEASFYSGTKPAFVNTTYGTLYGNSWVLTSELAFGYELKLTRNASIILENGYGYDTKPESGNFNRNVAGANKNGDRLYSTVSLGGKVKF